MCAYHTAVYPVQHQVSYLRSQDVIGVCLPYYQVLSIRYNVCTCRMPIYCCLSGTTCIPVIVQYTTTSLLLLSTWYTDSRVCRGYAIIELYLPRMNSQRGRWVCWKSKNTCLKSGLMRNTPCLTRYHICLMRVLIILLSIWYSVCACHSPVYHYITASAVYLIQRFTTACVLVM